MATKTRTTKIIVVTMPIGCDMHSASIFKIRSGKLIRVYSTQRSGRDLAAAAAINGYGDTVRPTDFEVDRRDLSTFFQDELVAVARELQLETV